jgi:hypothetical protein
MKRQYIITVEEDDEDETITFSLEVPRGSTLDHEDLCNMLVQVAQTIYEETQPLDSDLIH